MLGVQRVLDLVAQVLVVHGERLVIRTGLAVGPQARVDAAGGAFVVAQLLAPEVLARVLHAGDERRVEAPDLAVAEARPHRNHADVGLRGGAAPLVVGQAAAAGREAKRLDDLLDAIEVVDGELLPQRARELRLAALAGVAVAAE